MPRWSRSDSSLQRELLRLLRPPSPRLAEQVSERVRPELAEVGRRRAGHAVAEILTDLEAVVRSAGAQPDMAALAEFAQQIAAGQNPFE